MAKKNSVIPLVGEANPGRSKMAAVRWGRYQTTLPTPDDLYEWFVVQGYRGLGIVCGSVSRLVVLDFDDVAQASEFRRQHPDLTETYTVESGGRKLPHYYFRIPQGMVIQTRSVPGIDLRGEGSYVVAAPTQVGEQVWRLMDDREPRLLTGGDLRRVLAFMAAVRPVAYDSGLKGASDATPVYAGETGNSENGRRRNSDASDVLARYSAKLSCGRNNALFAAACFARDHGWSQDETAAVLVSVHGLQRAAGVEAESVHDRMQEARRTIVSVYSRPPRPVVEVLEVRGVGIPTPGGKPGLLNAVREWLLSHKLTAAARVLDGLYMAGLKVGESFTERHACDLLRSYGIGRRSIMAALKSVLPDGRTLFNWRRNSDASDSTPPDTPQFIADAACDSDLDADNKCYLIRGAERVKTPGRPARWYVVPDGAVLLSGVGIPTPPTVDALKPTDLRTPAAYRGALHREMVIRRPGQYPRRWLAKRLGVSRWSCRRYETEQAIAVQPMYQQRHVAWTNFESLLPAAADDAPAGLFLETADGKRYPPLRPIAMRLLSAHIAVVCKRQGANHYSPMVATRRNSDASESEKEPVGIPTPTL